MDLLVLQFLVVITITLTGLRWWKKIWNYIAEQWRIRKMVSKLPSSGALPLVGNALELRQTDQSVHVLAKKALDLGTSTYCFWLGPTPKVVITDPRDIETVMFSPKVNQKEIFYDLMEPVVGKTMFDSQDPAYRHHKKLRTSLLSASTHMHNYIQGFNKHSSILTKRLDRRVGKGEFDIIDDVALCLGDIIHDLVGFEATAQSGNPHSFLAKVTNTFRLFYYRAMRPWLYPDFTFALTNAGKQLFAAVKVFNSYVEGIIVDKRTEYINQSEEVRSKNIHRSLIDYFVDRMMMKNDDWTVTKIREEAAIIYAGAFEILHTLTAFVLLMLAMYPDVQQKARKEIADIVEGDDITLTEISNLKYLDMVVKETLRLFPAGPLLPRRLTEDLELTAGTIPKGVSVFMLLYATHRDPKQWEKPEEFIPERFSPENSKKRHPYSFVPFSAGLVSCPGKKYGDLCIKAVVAHVIRSYQLKTSETPDTLQTQAHVSIRSTNGFPMSITRIQA